MVHLVLYCRFLSSFAALCVLPLRCFAQPHVLEPKVKFSTTVTESSFGTTAEVHGGLRGNVYHIPPATWKLPNFAKLKPVGTIYTHCLNIPPRHFSEGFPGISSRDEWFAIDYTASFYVEKPGKYEFFLTSDDGSKLYIDGRTVINNDGHHPPEDEFGAINLKIGPHSIRVSYFQGPSYDIALVLGVRRPSEKQWRTFRRRSSTPPISREATTR